MTYRVSVNIILVLNNKVSFQVFLFLQVNGNLVTPLHVLANAEVVEVITYNVSFISHIFLHKSKHVLSFFSPVTVIVHEMGTSV